MRQAEQFLRAAILVFSEADELAEDAPAGEAGELDACFSRWLAGALRENTDGVEELSRELLSQLARRQILYVPVSKRGRVRKMLAARARQRMIERLLVWLPRIVDRSADSHRYRAANGAQCPCRSWCHNAIRRAF